MKLKGENSTIEIHVKVKYGLDKISSDILHFSAANILTNHGHIFYGYYAGIYNVPEGPLKEHRNNSM